jgi:hypothetical protein
MGNPKVKTILGFVKALVKKVTVFHKRSSPDDTNQEVLEATDGCWSLVFRSL